MKSRIFGFTNVERRITGLIAGVVLLCSGLPVLGEGLNQEDGSSITNPPETFLVVPMDVNASQLIDIDVDTYMFYAPGDEASRNRSLEIFESLVAHGRNVYLILGADTYSTSDKYSVFQNIQGNISFYTSEGDLIKAYILWDDPLSKGGAETRTWVANRTYIEFNVTLGIGIDIASIVRERDNITRKLELLEELKAIDFRPFSFVVSYYYSFVVSTGEPDVQMYEAIDPGELVRLKEAITMTRNISQTEDLESWFILRAHSVGNQTTSPLLMLLDLQLAKVQGFDAIGWFAIDRVAQPGEWYNDCYIGSVVAARDAWIRLYFLKGYLVGDAKEPTPADLIPDLLDNQRDINQTLILMQELSANLGSLNESLGQSEQDILDEVKFLNQSLHIKLASSISSMYGSLAETHSNLSEKLEQVHKDLESKLLLLYRDLATLTEGLYDLNRSWTGQLKDLDQGVSEQISRLDRLVQNMQKNIMNRVIAIRGKLDELDQDLGELGIHVDSKVGDVVKQIQILETNISRLSEIQSILREIEDDMTKLSDDTEDLMTSSFFRFQMELDSLRLHLDEMLKQNRADSRRDLAFLLIIFATIVFFSNIILLAIIRRRLDQRHG